MASIISVKGKWRAQIRRVGHKSECKTFPTKKQAELWVRQRESELDNAGGSVAPSAFTVANVIDAYRRLRDDSRPIADTSNEHYMLKALRAGLGDCNAARLSPDDLVAYCTRRKDEGAGPYTLNMEMSKLGTACRYGAVKLRTTLPDAVGAARPLLTHLRLIGGGGKRERRPTEDELFRLLDHIGTTYGDVYADAVRFAVASAMRRGEICALGHEDIDPVTRIVSIWRKHPRKGKVLEKVPLLDDAWQIVQEQPRGEPVMVTQMTERGEVEVLRTRVFPIEAGTLSKYFTNACRALSIPDLHLHDMRHEGASRLFEEGYPIEQVALVTGHKSWNMLRRYTQLNPEDMTRQTDKARNSSKT